MLHVSHALAAMSAMVAVFYVKYVLRLEKELSIVVVIHDSRTRFQDCHSWGQHIACPMIMEWLLQEAMELCVNIMVAWQYQYLMQSARLHFHLHIVVYKMALVWTALVNTVGLTCIYCTALGMFIHRFLLLTDCQGHNIKAVKTYHAQNVWKCNTTVTCFLLQMYKRTMEDIMKCA
jgi:hypothetical protein